MDALKRENYLYTFFSTLFANRRLIKRVFLAFAVLTLLLPLLLSRSYEISAEVMVQSKKVAQTEPNSASLQQETDKFLPPTLADMETESSILRSPELVRATLDSLLKEGHFAEEDGPLKQVLREYLVDPLRTHVLDPLRAALGFAAEPPRDNRLDTLTLATLEDLEVVPLPGSNVIAVHYRAGEPALGTLFVNRLLDTYLTRRHALHSNDLPEAFYEQKKAQYQDQLNGLEAQRLALLERIRAANPEEEITFRLNAINQEEQALNQYRDRLLENQRWVDYLQGSLAVARKARLTEYGFPYTFASTIDNAAFEDREIRQLGDRLIEQIGQYGAETDVYNPNSEPMKNLYAQISRTRQQFLQVIGNRISERNKELEIISGVIAQKTSRIEAYQARIRELQDAQSGLRQLNTEIEALHQAFFTYTQRYEESRSRALLDGGLSNAKVLSRPFEPSEASFPQPMRIIPLGLLTALLLAIAVGYIREFFDHRFKHPEQLLTQLGLPVLMTINAEQPAALPNPHKPGSLPWIRHWASD
ncbi:GumC family protein [Azotobacter salinestris]|uniref:GumC family protein n=1 Tax=Azotobacter salinestris TaxID=69964 RepID=UPI001266DD83|nr:Wzz/FepE/Etk N-terminal domain-containing protein [Azotobacter salinestris]